MTRPASTPARRSASRSPSPTPARACGPITLASGASIVVHVTADTAFANCGTYNNTANFTTTNDGSGPASASEDVNCSSLTLTKVHDAASVDAGSPIGFTITLANAGPGAATGAAISDNLPGGPSPFVHWVVASQSGGAGCAISGADGSQALACGPITLASGASIVVHVTADTAFANCGTYNNTANFTTTNDGSGPASASEDVNCSSLTLTKVHDAASVDAGSPIGFTITLANAGPGAATGAAISDNLPGGPSPFVHWVVASQSGGAGCAISGADGSQALACGPITLASGASIVVHVTADTAFANCGTYNNTANFTTTNDGSGPASASEDVNCSSLTLTKVHDAASVDAGSPIGFTITLANAGPGAATGAAISDNLPGGPSPFVHWV